MIDQPTQAPGPLLGIDFGLARTGLSASGGRPPVATPVGVLRGPLRRIEGEIAAACSERGARGLVIGLPRHMDGREGDLAPKVRRLAGRLARRVRIPVWLWDERLSTREVERRARESGRSARGRDDLVAALILQGFLDAAGWLREPDAEAPESRSSGSHGAAGPHRSGGPPPGGP
jgi:putative Holliday junction resolvase